VIVLKKKTSRQITRKNYLKISAVQSVKKPLKLLITLSKYNGCKRGQKG